MKSIVKTFLLNNMLEPSTWVGAIIALREIISFHPSTLMLVLGLLLVFVPDSAIRNFITARAAPLKKAIESW